MELDAIFTRMVLDNAEKFRNEPAPEPEVVHPQMGFRNGWPERHSSDLNPDMDTDWGRAFQTCSRAISGSGIAILHGKRGTGKTQIAAEVAKQGFYPLDKQVKLTSLKRKTAIYKTAMRFFLEIKASYKSKETTELQIIEGLTECGLLVIDELQERAETEFENRILTHVIDARYAANRPTILIANLTREGLMEHLSRSIVDRVMETGMRIECNWDSFRIVKK